MKTHEYSWAVTHTYVDSHTYRWRLIHIGVGVHVHAMATHVLGVDSHVYLWVATRLRMVWHVGAWTPTPLHTSPTQRYGRPNTQPKVTLWQSTTRGHTPMWQSEAKRVLGIHELTLAVTQLLVRTQANAWPPTRKIGQTSRILWQSSSGHAHLWAVTYVAHMATRTRALAYMARRGHRRYTSGGQVEVQALRASVTPKRIMHASGRCRARLKESGVIYGRTYTICTHALCDMGRWARECMGALGVGMTCCVGAHNA